MAEYDSGTDTTSVVNHLKYDAFGNFTAQSNSAAEPRHSFTGRQWDADAELFYYRARWYDPAVGRFISEDPIGFAAGDANLNRYVGNDPANYTDADGLNRVPNPAAIRPTGDDISRVTDRYDAYMAWLGTVWQVVMWRPDGSGYNTPILDESVGYFHVYSTGDLFTPSEWMATIAYDRDDPDDMLIAQLIATRMQNGMTVDRVGEITASAATNGFEIGIRTAFDTVDNIASFVEFTQEPSLINAAGMLPLIPAANSLRRSANRIDLPPTTVIAAGEGLAGDLLKHADNVIPKPGFTDVFIHATQSNFLVRHNGEFVPLSHRDVANFLESTGVTGDIRLISCNAGRADLAQNLSNKLNVTVEAATSRVLVPVDFQSALLLEAGGEWMTFTPF